MVLLSSTFLMTLMEIYIIVHHFTPFEILLRSILPTLFRRINSGSKHFCLENTTRGGFI